MRETLTAELLEVAKRRFGLLDYIRRWGAEPAQRGGAEWVLLCPRCGKQKLIVNVERGNWHCWVCYQRTPPDEDGNYRVIQGGGYVVELVAELEQLDRDAALARVLSGIHWTHGEIAALPQDALIEGWTSGPKVAPTLPLPDGADSIVDSDMPYLYRRGLSREDVSAFGLFVCRTGRYAGRLIFPVYEGGRLVYYQGRAMRDPYPGEKGFLKSLNPPKELGCAPSSDLLMNLDVARQHPRVCVTEGPIDCIHAGLSAVCSFGKQLSSTQLGKLVAAGVKAVDLMWDADAVKDMLAVYPLLRRFFDTRIVRLPSGDPGDYPTAQLDLFRAQAGTEQSRLAALP